MCEDAGEVVGERLHNHVVGTRGAQLDDPVDDGLLIAPRDDRVDEVEEVRDVVRGVLQLLTDRSSSSKPRCRRLFK